MSYEHLPSSSLLPPALPLPSFGPRTTHWSPRTVRPQQPSSSTLIPPLCVLMDERNPPALRDLSRVFGLDIQGRDCGDEAAQWFTNFLKTDAFRLVQFEKNMKGRAANEIFPSLDQNYQVSLQAPALPFRLPSGPTKGLPWGPG